jgi:hypothetical protein
MGRMELDRRLAAGANPLASPALARRAAILLTQRTRRRLAGGLEKAVLESEEPRPRRSAAVPVEREAVLHARDELLLLAAAVRSAPDPEPRGIAAVSLLLSDVAGPIFMAYPPHTLRDAVRRATTWVEAV